MKMQCKLSTSILVIFMLHPFPRPISSPINSILTSRLNEVSWCGCHFDLILHGLVKTLGALCMYSTRNYLNAAFDIIHCSLLIHRAHAVNADRDLIENSLIIYFHCTCRYASLIVCYILCCFINICKVIIRTGIAIIAMTIPMHALLTLNLILLVRLKSYFLVMAAYIIGHSATFLMQRTSSYSIHYKYTFSAAKITGPYGVTLQGTLHALHVVARHNSLVYLH